MTFSGIIFLQSVYNCRGHTFAKSEMPDDELPPEEADLTPREAAMPPELEANLTPDNLATLQDAKMTPWDAILHSVDSTRLTTE